MSGARAAIVPIAMIAALSVAAPCARSYQTAAGEIPIEELRVCDVVLSRVDRDPDGPADWAVVTRIFESVGDGTLTLMLEDGRSFTVTPEHELWTFEGGWQPAQEVGIAEHVRGLDDTPLAVISIDVDRTPHTVYNLEVAGARTYFAEGVWVHNNSCSRGRLNQAFGESFEHALIQMLGLPKYVGPKLHANGVNFVPDIVHNGIIADIKGGEYVYLTPQLKAMAEYAMQNGLKPVLYAAGQVADTVAKAGIEVIKVP